MAHKRVRTLGAAQRRGQPGRRVVRTLWARLWRLGACDAVVAFGALELGGRRLPLAARAVVARRALVARRLQPLLGASRGQVGYHNRVNILVDLGKNLVDLWRKRIQN